MMREVKNISNKINPKKVIAKLPTKDCIEKIKKEQIQKKAKYFSPTFYKNNRAFFITILVYVVFSLILVGVQLTLYANEKILVKLARIGGILLSFNLSLTILLVQRGLLSSLRNTYFGKKFLPVDDCLLFHKFIGVSILVYSLLHVVNHLLNLSSFDFKSKFEDPEDYLFDDSKLNLELIFTSRVALGLVEGLAIPTGWVLVVAILILVIFSIPILRQKGYFELFWITHKLYILIYVALVLHCLNFWKWFIVPLILVLYENVSNFFRSRSSLVGKTNLTQVTLFDSKVTKLVISRPSHFQFRSGDYIFIKLPAIARSEWHPFTISSAPEQKNEICLHVRSLGNWTNKLYDYFSNYSNNFPNASFAHPYLNMSKYAVLTEVKKEKEFTTIPLDGLQVSKGLDIYKIGDDDVFENNDEKRIQSFFNSSTTINKLEIPIRIKGPFSTDSMKYSRSEHAVLIAGGIGVTPFASILQSLCHKFNKSRHECSNCSYSWYDELEHKKLKRVDFIWVNRDYQAFEWFVELLGELESQQLKTHRQRFLNIHLYMTSSKNNQELKPIDPLEGKVSKNDNFSLKLNCGRPNLDKLFEQIKGNGKTNVDVFFCGNPELGQVVQKNTLKHKFKYYKENF